MPLASGQSILHFRLVDKIGQGGMGEVWRATDTKLDRDVALKFLPDAVTHDVARLERFVREAKTLAALDHPGIAAIYGIEEHGEHRFLVMELVPGEDLSERLEGGTPPLAETLEIAVRIASAVEVAHARGIVHRDLKPANVKRTPDGRIKVLDFGLAKVLGPEVSSGGTDVGLSPTLTSAGTAAGVILGTAAYMSPEQARGRPVDKRTDIWSFGVVLYELLTGDNPFRGETVADSVGAILHRDPDMAKLPPDTPPAVLRVLRRCLARKRAQRLHDIADARLELEEAIANPEADAAPAPAAEPPRPASRAPWLALALLLPFVAAVAWWAGSRPEPVEPDPVRTFELLPDGEPDDLALSADGSRLAYELDGKVYVRAFDTLEPRDILDQGSREILDLFWSPDGRSLGIVRADGALERVDLDGGAPITLVSSGLLVASPTWGDDGYIYFVRFQGGIERIPENGGATEEVVARDDELIDYHGMTMLPEGRGFLTVPHLSSGEYRQIWLERPGEDAVVMFESDSSIANPKYSATGHVLFVREESPRGLWALPFSLDTSSAEGEPFLVVPDLSDASLSDRGDLIYSKAVLQRGKQEQELVWYDREGTKVRSLGLPLFGASSAVMSPDGTEVAVTARGVGRPSTDKVNLWVVDVERGSATKLTQAGIAEARPTWSEDGTRIAVLRDVQGADRDNELIAIRADGSGEPEVVLAADISFLASLSRDWSWAAFMSGSFGDEAGLAIVRQRLDDPSTRATVFDGPDQDVMPAIHPDGDWVAYASGTLAALDTFVQPFPEGDGRFKVSVGNGGLPLWSNDGSRLYYMEGGPANQEHDVMEVTFDDSGARPVLGQPKRLFAMRSDALWPSITADDEFLLIEQPEPEEGEEAPDTTGVVLVQNWVSRSP